MLIGARWATGLPEYGRLPAIFAEARSFSLLRASAVRARARSCRSLGVRRTRFGFSDAFGFEAVVWGFETLRAGVRAAAVLPDFLN